MTTTEPTKHLHIHRSITRLSSIEERILELTCRVREAPAPPVSDPPLVCGPSLESVLESGGDDIEHSITRSIQLLADLENLLF